MTLAILTTVSDKREEERVPSKNLESSLMI